MKSTITGGTLKGRPLTMLRSEEVRPTQNKLRQAAFNMLLARVDISDARVLDLCCGTGALGLEALSRGASHATLVDTDTSTAQANIKSLGLSGQAVAIKSNVTTWAPEEPADLILTDPPYKSDILTILLARHALLGTSQSWWLIEYNAHNAPIIPATLTVVKEKKHGHTVLALLTPTA